MSTQVIEAHAWPTSAVKLPELEEIQREFAEVGYYCQREDTVAIKKFFHTRAKAGGVPALYLTGVPGVGKTFLAERAPKTTQMLGMHYLFMQANAWDSTEQYFRGINVAAAVKRDHANVDAAGILAKACSWSQKERVLVCIDELDKTEDRAQNLLLDFLQYCRAQWEPGTFIQGNPENLFFIGTSNETKPLSPALMRRFRYHRMVPLPIKLQCIIISKTLGFPKPLVHGIIEAAIALSKKARRELSMQEAMHLCEEIVFVSECAHDVQAALEAWVTKNPKYETDAKAAGLELNDKLTKYKAGDIPQEWIAAV
jgi:MoxR-like ATPase